MDKKLIKATVEGELTGKAAGSGSKNEETPVSFTISKAKGEDGNELAEMAGKILTLDKGKKRDELLKKYKQGDKVTLLGKIDVGKSVLLLESFKEASGSGSK
jgi:F0F1-type ATP synthase beta subunit